MRLYSAAEVLSAIPPTSRRHPALLCPPSQVTLHSGNQRMASRYILRSERSRRISGSHSRVLDGVSATDPTGPADDPGPGSIGYAEGTWQEVGRSRSRSPGSTLADTVILPPMENPAYRMITRTREVAHLLHKWYYIMEIVIKLLINIQWRIPLPGLEPPAVLAPETEPR
jgi:hypothetical protein